MLDFAQQIKDELIQIRRTLHRCPEVGDTLPQTKAFVMETLTAYGYTPAELCQSGIVAVLEGAKPGKTLMLRADMDALKIPEETHLPFAATNGCMHACGHDMHTAMLLGAAKLLMQFRSELSGAVKFVFQPNEEGFAGAKAMQKAGVLENPPVDAGLALHIASGTPSGTIVSGKGVFMAGCTFFRIRVTGTGCHGAMPDTGVDPVNIAAHIHLSLQELIAREISPLTAATVTVGRFTAGEAPNVIPEEVIMEGSIRALDQKVAAYLYERIVQIADSTARLFRGQATVEKLASVPPLKNDEVLTERLEKSLRQILPAEQVVSLRQGGMGSEDFAVFTHQIPCAYLLIGAGTAQENAAFGKPMHNAGVVFSEDILPLGSAVFAHCALHWQ
jgi:amidohydrolase